MGIPIYQDPDRAARSMAALREYYKLRDRIIDRRLEEELYEETPKRCASAR
jgi:hypothetical protein